MLSARRRSRDVHMPAVPSSPRSAARRAAVRSAPAAPPAAAAAPRGAPFGNGSSSAAPKMTTITAIRTRFATETSNIDQCTKRARLIDVDRQSRERLADRSCHMPPRRAYARMTPPRSRAAVLVISGTSGRTHRELPAQQATPDQPGPTSAAARTPNRVRRHRATTGRADLTRDDPLALVMPDRHSDNASTSRRSFGPQGSGIDPSGQASCARCMPVSTGNDGEPGRSWEIGPWPPICLNQLQPADPGDAQLPARHYPHPDPGAKPSACSASATATGSCSRQPSPPPEDPR